MKQFKFIAVALLGSLVLGACSTSNQVVGGGIFQKRKYTGGVYWDRTERVKTTKAEKEEEEFDIFKINEESQKKYVSSTTIYNEDRVVASSENSAPEFISKNANVIEATSNANNNQVQTTEKNSNEEGSSLSKFEDKNLKFDKKVNSPKSNSNLTNILMLVLLIVLIIILLTLLNGLLGGLLSWILGIVILVLIIFFLLRLLGVV